MSGVPTYEFINNNLLPLKPKNRPNILGNRNYSVIVDNIPSVTPFSSSVRERNNSVNPNESNREYPNYSDPLDIKKK